tara:strand:+ start:201 stop:728 length:528 start_codon:yes stop_codon:yes gene_type:complete
MPSVKSLIPLTILYTTFTAFFTNYVLLKYITILPNVPDFFKYLVYSIFFYFLYAFYISYSSSNDRCGKFDKKQSTIHATKSVIYVLVTYVAIYAIMPLRQPFVELMGDSVRTSSVIESFYISLNLIISTLINHFDAAKYICRVTPDQLEKNLKKLDKYLNKKDRKRSQKRIVVKD